MTTDPGQWSCQKTATSILPFDHGIGIHLAISIKAPGDTSSQGTALPTKIHIDHVVSSFTHYRFLGDLNEIEEIAYDVKFDQGDFGFYTPSTWQEPILTSRLTACSPMCIWPKIEQMQMFPKSKRFPWLAHIGSASLFVRNAYPAMCPDARVFHPWLTETSRHLKWLRSNSARTTRITTKESSFCPSDSEKGFAFPESERPSKLGWWRTCCERPQPIAHYHETAPPLFSAHVWAKAK